GSKEQAEDLIQYIAANGRNDKNGIWETNIFGKSIRELVEDGIQNKVHKLTDDSQLKLQEAIQKVVNDSNGGLVCIII
ncbi:MAG: sporulation stage IV protein A, partial [Acetivibrio ethanolgignens]